MKSLFRSRNAARLTSLASLGFALSVVTPSALAAPRRRAASGRASGATAAESPRTVDDAIAGAIEKLTPSVVSIDVVTRDSGVAPAQPSFGRGSGTGLIISADGAILTTDHLIEHALAIYVRLADGKILSAKLAGRDPATDLAVLRVDAIGLQHASFADSDAARIGEHVVVVGAHASQGYSVTTGVVSARGRSGLGSGAAEDYLQTDAAIHAGNAGGPLATLDGRVVAVGAMRTAKGSGGIGIAMPSNIARGVAEQLLAKGRVDRAWLGVGAQDVTPDVARELHGKAGDGALVNAVYPDSPGARGNLKAGDVIVSVDGHAVRGAQDLMREVLGQQAGRVVALEVVRAGKRYATSITLASRGEPAPRPIPAQADAPPGSNLGLVLRDVPAQSAAALGLPPVAFCQVASVVIGSPADRAGLSPNDAIIEVDSQLDPSAAIVQQSTADGHALLRVRRGNAFLYVALQR